MSEDQPKKGKRKVEKGYKVARTFRFRDEDVQRLEWLAKRWGSSTAAVLRQLLGNAAREEGMVQEDPDEKAN